MSQEDTPVVCVLMEHLAGEEDTQLWLLWDNRKQCLIDVGQLTFNKNKTTLRLSSTLVGGGVDEQEQIDRKHNMFYCLQAQHNYTRAKICFFNLKTMMHQEDN